MSLRTDIHAAFDEVAPSTAGLPERVVEAVVTEHPRRDRSEAWSARLRAPLSLVAVLLLLAMVVGVLVGSRLTQDWNAFHRAASASGGPSELAQLEARPMQLPPLVTADTCPETPIASGLPGSLFPSGSYGGGPVYVQGGSTVSDAWGTYWYLAAITDESNNGLVLFRGQDLQTTQPVIFVGNWATGPSVGSDTLNGKVSQQHVELVLDMRHPPVNMIHAGTVAWGFTAGLAKGASGCIGWQIDATGYPTQIIVTRSHPG